MNDDSWGLSATLEPSSSAAPTTEPIAAARPSYIIDTAVAIKGYIPEALSAAAKQYLGQGGVPVADGQKTTLSRRAP
jgi:hypothetical protein